MEAVGPHGRTGGKWICSEIRTPPKPRLNLLNLIIEVDFPPDRVGRFRAGTGAAGMCKIEQTLICGRR